MLTTTTATEYIWNPGSPRSWTIPATSDMIVGGSIEDAATLEKALMSRIDALESKLEKMQEKLDKVDKVTEVLAAKEVAESSYKKLTQMLFEDDA